MTSRDPNMSRRPAIVTLPRLVAASSETPRHRAATSAGRETGTRSSVGARRVQPAHLRGSAGDQAAWPALYGASSRLTTWLGSLPSSDWSTSPEDIAADASLTLRPSSGSSRAPTTTSPAGCPPSPATRGQRARKAVRRRTDPATEQASEDHLGGRPDPSGAVGDLDSTRRLLAHLSPREAEVVACIDVVGLDVVSTARALGMKPTAVRVARHRALGRLRRIVGPT